MYQKKKYFFLVVAALFCIIPFAQTFGPNSPSSATNNVGVGVNAWTTPTNAVSSNNSYASCVTKGITNYIMSTNYGFTVPVTTNINGIQLDVEKTSFSPTVVTVLNNWTAGLTKTVSAGSNRMLLFYYSSENGNGSRALSAVRYGGQALTQIASGTVSSGSAFVARMEYWVLLNSAISSATSTAFTVTFAAVASLVENVEYYASAVYAGVDQVLPFTSTQTYTQSNGSASITVSPTLATTGGGMVVSAIHCGNNRTPGTTPGGTNCYLISNTFTETIDTYTGCTSCGGASLTGMCTQVAHQSIASAGTVAPSYTFAGTPNRQVVIYTNLTNVRELDNSVRLVKAGSVTGSNLAYTVGPWNTVDTYTSYGSSSNLWGTTWSVAEVNATNFGAAFSASVSNGTAQIDHMRITITGTSTLPVELINFWGRAVDTYNELYWETASELESKEFIVERSSGYDDFVAITSIPGKGTTSAFSSYNFTDESPGNGNSYYRLKQVDLDGTFKYSPIIVVTRGDEDNVMVYPNPSCDGKYTLAGSQVLKNGVSIYSVDMKLIKQIENNSALINLSINELTDGEYFIVYNQNDKNRLIKIIKSCR